MAKDKNELEDDDLGSFDDFEFGDDFGDFDTPPAPDDRKPITKVATSFLAGAAEELTDPTRVKKMTLDALPKGYGKAADLVDNVAATGRDLYHTTAEELKPVIRDAKRLGRRALPAVKGLLPDRIAKKLEEITKEEPSGPSVQQTRDSQMQSEVSDIFKLQMENDAQAREEDNIEKQSQRKQDTARFKTELQTLNSILSGINRQVAYQDQIASKYQRKHLELEYLQYFTLRDTFELHKASAKETKQQLQDIVKNTGLPEFVKSNLSEHSGHLFREKLLSAASSKVKDFAGQFLGKYKDNIVKSIKGNVASFKDSAMQGLTAGDMLLDAREMQAETGEKSDPYKSGGNMAGKMLGGYAGDKLAKLLRPLLEANPGIAKMGNKLEYGVDNLPALISDWMKGDQGENTGSPGWNKFLRAFKDLAPVNVVDNKVGESDLIKSQDAVPFTHLARKSLTDIIPGYLSRIHHELAIIRTGDPSIKRLSYDLKDGSFATMDKISKSLAGSLFDQTKNFDGVKDTTNKLIDELESKQGEKLSPKLRKELYDKFIGEAASGQGRFDVKKLADVDTWSHLSDDEALKLSYMFSDDVGEDRQNEMSKHFLKIRDHVNNPTDAIKGMINSGQQESLRDLGLITGEGENREVSQERIIEILRQGGFGEPTDSGTNPLGGPPHNPNNGPNGGNGLGGLRTPNPAPKGAWKDAEKVATPKNPNEFMETIGEYQMLLLEDIRKGIANPAALAQYADAARNDPKASEEECTCVDKMIEAYNAGNEQLVKQLSAMYEVLISGQLQTMSMNIPFDPEKLGMRTLGGHLGAGLGKLKGAGKWGFGKVSSFYKGAIGLQGKIIKGGFKGAWAGAKGAGNLLFGKAKDKLNEWGDVYIKGHARPILTWAQLKAGEYLNEDGTPITSWKDVKGPVKNKAGQYILTAEQFAQGLVDEQARPMFTKLLDFGKNFASRVTGFITSPFKAIKSAMKNTWNMAKNIVERPRDMYIPGNPVPVLLASVMAAGGYRNADGSPILKWTDIKGTVYDLENNVVVSLETMRQGLVDIAGKKLQTLKGAIWGGVKSLVGGAFSMGRKVLGSAKSMLGKGIGALKKGASGLMGMAKGKLKGMKMPGFGGSSEMMEVIGEYQILLLEEIRDGIRDLKPRTVRGDVDGDGVREGSSAFLSARRKKTREEREAKQKAKDDERKGKQPEKKSGLMGILMSMAGMLGAIPVALQKMATALSIKKAAGLAGDLLGSAGDMAGRGRRGGALRTGGRLLGRAAMGAGRLAMGVGRFALGGTGTLIRGAWALGSAAIGVLGAPIVLGAAAVAAVGYLAYKGYKAYKKSQNSDLLKYRIAQYGIDIEDEDQAGKIFELEAIVAPAVKFNSTQPKIEWKEIKVERIKELFGLKDDDKEGIDRFGRWFETRFGPVLISHLKMLQKYSTSTKLEEADEAVKIEDKLKFLEGVQVDDPEKTYGDLTSPFDEDNLKLDAEGVKKVYDAVVAHIKENLPEKGKGTAEEPKTAAKDAAASVAAAGAAAATMKQKGFMDGVKDALANTWVAKTGGMIAAGASAIFGVLAKPYVGMFNWIKEKIFGKDFKVPSILNREIDPLTSIRYRLYGVHSMEYARVSPISKLEEVVIEDISYNGQKKAQFDGDAEDVWKEVAGMFTTTPDSEEVMKRWTDWFSNRFLPVLINYLTAVRSFKNNGNPFEAYDMLRASQSLEVARFMNSANAEEDTKSENNRSVWGVSTSPFDDYPLNTDAKSIEPFMSVLQQDANQEILNEKVKTGQAAKTQSMVNKALGTNGSNGPVGMMAMDRGNAVRSGGSSALLKAMYGSMQTAGGDAGYMNGGLAVEHPGNGTGGSVNDLPKITGADGQYSSYKDMIVAVSKMVGVDPGLMATMAALESNFQGSVKASSSSASGLYQFIDATWKTMLGKYGAKYGLDPNTPPTDPRANALIGAEYIRENAEKLEKGLGRKPTDTDIYLAHFLGPNGALKFLSSNGSANAATIMPKAANANKSIFFADGRPRTISQVYAEIDRRVKVKRDMYAGDARSAMGMAPGTANTPTPAIPGVTASAGLGMSAAANDPGTASGGGASVPSMGTGTVGIMAPSSAPSPSGGGSSKGPIGIMAPAANQGPVSASQQALATNPNLSSAESAGNATLQREKSTDGGTFGKLTLPDGTTFNTLELPWRNNESGKSCIPPGTYKVETRNSPKFGPGTYEVKGVPGRTAILIHSGNYAGNVDKGQKSNVEGCILLGFSRSTQSGQPMIQESRAAMQAFTEKMAGRPFVLTVVSAEGDTVAPAAPASNTGVSPLAQSVGATMPTTTTPSTSAPTPYVAPVSQSVAGPNYSGGGGEPSLGAPEATLLRKQQAEREAQATQLQSMNADATLNQNVGSITDWLSKQLEVQEKMAASLESIDKNIAGLATGEAAKAAEPAKPEAPAPTNRGARPAEVAVRTTPISMKRMRA
jgi:hypothetical protein